MISTKGMMQEMIMVPIMVFPINLNQVRLKSRKLPPTRPNVIGLWVMFALTRKSRMAVLMNCIQKMTFVVRKRRRVSLLKSSLSMALNTHLRRMMLKTMMTISRPCTMNC